MNRALVACAAVFLAAHLPLLPPSLDDIDSINFALGVRDFDVARHQPHPPGYPLFIALGKLSTPAIAAAGVAAPQARGLAIWSALAGAACIFLLFALFRALDRNEHRALWATIIAVASPLFWFTALRPLSDMTGLAAALAAQALLVPVVLGRAGGAHLLGGALVAGLAIGFRSQTFVLTLPLLAVALLRPSARLSWTARFSALIAVVVGGLAWAVPLVVASGGLTEYLVALGSQAGEDFEGVEMLWLTPAPRVLANALLYTFLWPWGHIALGAVVSALFVAGTALAVRQAPRSLLVLAVAYGPYAAFHLLFQEFEMVRYALPLVVPSAYLATVALSVRRFWLAPGAAAIAGASLILALPATLTYAREASPATRLLQDVRALAAGEQESGNGSEASLDFAFHGVFRRAVQWEGPMPDVRILKAPHGREFLTPVMVWRQSPDTRIAFAADPRRTDLALVDPQARRLMQAYRWGFPEPPFVGGSRPGVADLYLLRSPGWMLDRGWALTAEIGGITARDRRGPHVEPSVAWVRTRSGEALLMLGGRHVGPDADSATRLSVMMSGQPLDTFDIGPGPFFRLVPIPAGTLKGLEAFVPLVVRASGVGGSSAAPVRLEQFDVQSPGAVMVGFTEGWHEPEYNRKLGRGWRWASERSTLWVRPIGRDVQLRLTGESPLRYFDRPPTVRVLIDGQEVARFEPREDFSEVVVLPAGLLESARGEVVLESDLWFVPPGPDPRHLSLRIYDVTGT